MTEPTLLEKQTEMFKTTRAEPHYGFRSSSESCCNHCLLHAGGSPFPCPPGKCVRERRLADTRPPAGPEEA